jgi:glycosyltransferase involved in cell wall biosynthesis
MLFVASDRYPPYRPDIKTLFGQELGRRGHEIEMLIQSQEPCDKPYRTRYEAMDILDGPTDTGESFLKRLHKHILGIRHDLRLFSLLRKGKYDFIQVKDKFFAALFAILASRLYGIPFYYWLSFSIPEASFYRVKQGTARYPAAYLIRGAFIHVLLYKVICRLAGHVFVQSDKMKSDLADKGIAPEKMTPVPMGVSLADWDSSERPESAFDGPTAVYLGAMGRARRLDIIIEAFAKAKKSYPSARLLMVGGSDDPDDLKHLEQVAEAEGIGDDVIFTGFVERSVAWGYVQQADICLSPMYPSPMLITTTPTKCMEYLGLGKPVVGNDIPDMKKVLGESGGGICVSWDVDAFAEAIRKLFGDPERAAAMGEKGREWILANREYGIIADYLEDKYFALLGWKTEKDPK